MPAASLGQYASLSFVVIIGRSEIINSGSWFLTPGFWILLIANFRHFRHFSSF